MIGSTGAPGGFYADIRSLAVFSAAGPQPQFLVDSQQMRVVVTGLEAGQEMQEHPESLAMYHFLAGFGVMQVNGESFPVAAGVTVIVPPQALRGLKAETRLVFLAAKPGQGAGESAAETTQDYPSA